MIQIYFNSEKSPFEEKDFYFYAEGVFEGAKPFKIHLESKLMYIPV
jgi:hypothetical protein